MLKNSLMKNLKLGDRKIIDMLKGGAIGVLPTDTVYGVVCDAFNKDAIERMYKTCKRDTNKRFIMIISEVSDLDKFGVQLSEKAHAIADKAWPGKISIVMECHGRDIDFLLRGGKTLAFRVPDDQKLRKLLNETGPLATTSANPQGKSISETIEQAKNYFQDQLDFYIDSGKLGIEPSTIIKLTGDKAEIIREGVMQYNKDIYNK